MIEFISGTLVSKNPTSVVVEANGVGYKILISVTTYQKLPSKNENCKLLTYFHVREQEQTLYGFSSEEERSLFLQLTSVSGIGPKLAQGALSGATPRELKKAVVLNDIKYLTSIPGVGKKTAQRLVVELKEKFSKETGIPIAELEESYSLETFGEENDTFSESSEAVLALVSLGYSRQVATSAIHRVLKAHPEGLAVSELIKRALRHT
ncbi:MAG: Holliday junction branch migration protein RuvA [Calditrichaeota bacterium]|nr:MAG: Holliday junction branch migration protein RuvA [Calditrichota bacterium]